MEVINPHTGNRYRISKDLNFEVRSSKLKGVYYSRNLHAAVVHILKTERAHVIFNLTDESLYELRSKLEDYNLQQCLPTTADLLKSMFLREKINLSYYDNLLLAISKSFTSDAEQFEFGEQYPFHVNDELAHIVKTQLEQTHLVSAHRVLKDYE